MSKRHTRPVGGSSIPCGRLCARGFSMVELLVVLFIIALCATLVIPQIRRTANTMRLRASAAELAGLIQNARIFAAKNNRTYDIKYTTIAGQSAAYVDLNLNGSYDLGEPLVMFNRGVTPATGAPSGGSGQPAAYTMNSDTCTSSCSTPYDNNTTLAFNSRGLPCKYDTTTTPATCLTPASTYFVYYLNGTPGWSGVVVTIGGRTRVMVWDGAAWND